jgi:phosphatidylglycerophosphate synthase
MPDEKSFPGSAAEFDYQKSVQKKDNQFTSKFFPINKFLNRPLANLIVRAIYRTKISPNHLTLVSFVIGLAGGYLFYRGQAWSFAAGGILAQLSSIVDCADGQLARAREKASEFGAYLDLMLDRLGEFFLLAGVMVGCFKYFGRPGIFMLGLFTIGVYFLQTTLFYLTQSYRKRAQSGEAAEMRAWLLFLMLIFGVVNRLDIGIYFLLVVCLGINLYLIVAFLFLKRA